MPTAELARLDIRSRPPARARCWSTTAIARFAPTGLRYWRKLTGEQRRLRAFPGSGGAISRNSARRVPACRSVHRARWAPRKRRRGKLPDSEPCARQAHSGWRFIEDLPGFAAVSERVYAFIAAHRSASYRISLCLWGKDYEPPRYDLVSFLFLRLFGLIYLSAFVSFGVQALGLIGSHGILPLANMVDEVSSGRRGALSSSCRWCSG